MLFNLDSSNLPFNCLTISEHRWGNCIASCFFIGALRLEAGVVGCLHIFIEKLMYLKLEELQIITF
jgi:hypothetical protein